jgi:hypothetical protein
MTMRRVLLGLVFAALTTVAAWAQLQQIPFVRPSRDGLQAPVGPSGTWHGPTSETVYETSVAAQVMTGTATAGSFALTSVDMACSGATSLQTAAAGTTSWALAIEFAVGTTTCWATISDSGSGVFIIQKTFIVTVPDVSDPVVTVATNAGVNYSVSTASTDVSVDCSDNVACQTLAWSRTGAVGTCTLNSLSGPATNWTCAVTLVATNNRTTANAFTFTGTDQADGDGTDTITITRTVTLEITSSSLPTATQNTAYSSQLSERGGTGTGQAWDNNSGGTSLAAYEAACTGLSVSSSGLVSGTPTDLGDGTCNATVKLTDSGANSDTAAISIPVVAQGAEGPFTFFTEMSVRSDFENGWQLRSQTEIESRLYPNSGRAVDGQQVYHYEYPSATPSLCDGGSCSDDYPTPQDAAKMVYEVNACVPNILTKTIASSTQASPTVLTINTIAKMVIDVTYPVTITGHSNAQVNVTGQIKILTKNTSTDQFTAQLIGVNTSTTGTLGSAAVTECDCAVETVCASSDDSAEDLWFPSTINHRDGNAQMLIWDWWYDDTWYFYFKAFYPALSGGTGSVTKTGSLQMMSNDDAMPGNGTGADSVGVLGHSTWMGGLPHASLTLHDPFYPTGEGGSGVRSGGGTAGGATYANQRVLATNWHPQRNRWTRFWLYTKGMAWSDDLFDKWRTATSQTSLDAGWPISSCVVAGTTTTCTVAPDWKVSGSANKSFKCTVSGNDKAELNATRLTCQTVASGNHTQFKFPTPAGVADGTYNNGTFDPWFMYTSFWAGDESRDATRIMFGTPQWWDETRSYIHMYYGFDTSEKSGHRTHVMTAYTRSVIYLENPTMDLTGTCDNDDPPASPTNLDRGWCTIDAGNNPTIFKKPKR